MRQWKRLLASFAVAVTLIVGGASAAVADAPLPNMPDGEVGGGLLHIDDDITPGQCGDGASFFECYGVAGQFYTDPDTGLIDGLGDRSKAAANDAANIAANALMTLAQMSTAFTARTADSVYPTADDYQVDPSGAGNYKAGNWLGAFEPLWLKISTALKEGFTQPFVPIVAGIILLSLIVGMMRGSISKVVTTFLLAFVAVGAIAVGTDYPVQAGRGADKLIVESTTELRNAVTDTQGASSPGYALVGPLSDRIIYDRWVAGELGSSTSQTAKEYGPVLYKAQAFSWDEAADYRSDPSGAGKAILERKQKEWNDAKDAIKDEDPDAYAYLTGEKGAGNRIAQGFMMNVTWLTTMPMIFVSLLLTALSFIVIRLVVVFLPVIALVGAIPRFHGTLKSTAELFAAAIVNSVIFGTVATLVATVNIYIMSDDLGFDWSVQLLFATIFTVLAWTATAPFRKLTRFATNWDPTRGVTGILNKIYGLLKTLAGAALGGAAGGAVASAVANPQPATATPELQPQAAQQAPTTTFTRADHPPVVEAELITPRPYQATYAVGDIIDGETYDHTGVTVREDVYAIGSTATATEGPIVVRPETSTTDTATPVVINDDVTVIPSTDVAVREEPRQQFVVWDGGRYVIDSSGEVSREDADA